MLRFRTLILVTLAGCVVAQSPADFPRLTNAGIQGAPKLSQPSLVMGSTRPVMGGQHGLAAPAAFDWNKDGKKDLLIGEFETTDCWVRVYLNVGTDAEPKFTDDFLYAKTADGTRMKIDSW